MITASDSTQYAWEDGQTIGEAENSVFTRYLVQGLRTGEADIHNRGQITLTDLYDYIHQNVVREARRQTPQIWSYNREGEIIIARSPRPVVPAELSLELLHLINLQ